LAWPATAFAALQAECGIKESRRAPPRIRGAIFEGMKFPDSFPADSVAGFSPDYGNARSKEEASYSRPGHGRRRTLIPGQTFGLEIYGAIGTIKGAVPSKAWPRIQRGKDGFPLRIPFIREKWIGRPRCAPRQTTNTKHSYSAMLALPNNPVIFRGTEQWFIKNGPGASRKQNKRCARSARRNSGVENGSRVGRRGPACRQ